MQPLSILSGGDTGLFTLVRIGVPSTINELEGRAIKHTNPDHVWDYVQRNHRNWRSDQIKVLYMTRRHLQDDTSLIVDAKDPDALSDFLVKHFASLKYVRSIWVLNLAKMRFFKLSMEHPGFFRFTVTIDALPSHIEQIYEAISDFKPGRDVMINYIAHTYQPNGASLMVSVLARSRNHMETFVEDCIKTLDGVVDTETTLISKTARLVSAEEWEESVGPYFFAPGGESIKDIDPLKDDSLIAGC